MRETGHWCRGLEAKLRDELRGRISVRHFLQIELALFLVETVVPHETVDAVPVLLSGFPVLDGSNRALANARYLLSHLKNPHAWKAALDEYMAIAEHLRGYRVQHRRAHRLDVSAAANRFAVYGETLSAPLPHRVDDKPRAGAGTWLLKTRAGDSSVRIPPELVKGPHSSALTYPLAPPRLSVAPLEVAWTALLSTADWMDSQQAPNGGSSNWRARLERVQFEMFDDETNRFRRKKTLVISGRSHVVGMVSSGKSTLMDVLAVWTAREGRRVTLVVGDVVSAVRRATMFRGLGVRAAPILGRSNRRKHVERLHRIVASEGTGSILDVADPAFEFLSTACAVDGLREHEKPFEVGDYPCESFYPTGDTGGQVKAHACPFFAGCQQHVAAREAMSAQVWVTTPAALVYTQLPSPMMHERTRFAELVYRTQDLVIVDEADQVQVQLDHTFSPHESLFGGPEGSWLDELEERVDRELRETRRSPLRHSDVTRWVSAADNAKTTCNRLYGLLNQERTLRDWVERDHFTEWSLAGRLARKWSGAEKGEDNKEAERLRRHFADFNLAPLGHGDGPPAALVALAQQCVAAPDDAHVRGALKRWIASPEGGGSPSVDMDEAALQLEFTLLVAVLASRVEVLIRMWRQVETPLNLDRNAALFHRPPEDFRLVLPDSAMGNQLGFQYVAGTDDDGEAMGELRFFRCMGVGRWLLLHLHSLFDGDGTKGPNVLMLSGTSWAGSAPGHHLQIPVDGLLRAPAQETDSISRSRFEFRPFFEPASNRVIKVSGHGEPDQRRRALREILRQLAGPSRLGNRKSILERDVEGLSAGRQRALILVGSYPEARNAHDDLLQIQPSWRDRVVSLVSDDDDEGVDVAFRRSLRRGDVERFGRGAADILIAPLKAVERGHNILNESQRAAVGIVYLLIRPMMRPDDMTFAVQAINRFAVEESASLAAECSRRTIADAGRAFRDRSFDRWRKLMSARMTWSSLGADERKAVTWNHLVSLWQVIGRLVRGGEPARVVFVDGAFAPHSGIDDEHHDTPDTSLLLSMQRILEPYFDDASRIDVREREVARALYGPLRTALGDMKGISHGL